MKSRLIAVVIAIFMAGALSQCTQQYSDGKATKSDGTLRPGEAPIGIEGKPAR